MLKRLLQKLRLGIGSLMLHKLRSALAVLGILIGVTAVIWLVAMGEGVSYQAQQQIKDLGATNVLIRSIKPPQESTRAGGSSCSSASRAVSRREPMVDALNVKVPRLEGISASQKSSYSGRKSFSARDLSPSLITRAKCSRSASSAPIRSSPFGNREPLRNG